MIPPTPGPNPASRLFGPASPPDGGGPIGPDQWWPDAIEVPPEQVLNALNPLQHLPGIGMIYRAATGQQIPATLKVLGAGLLGGPMGMAIAGFTGVLMEVFTLKPDLSRPAVPAGMSQTGSEAGVQPVTPGTLLGTAYTSLATTTPDWLAGGTALADGGAGSNGAMQASAEYRRTLALEKGIA